MKWLHPPPCSAAAGNGSLCWSAAGGKVSPACLPQVSAAVRKQRGKASGHLSRVGEARGVSVDEVEEMDGSGEEDGEDLKDSR